MSIRPASKVVGHEGQQPLLTEAAQLNQPAFLSDYVKISEELGSLEKFARKIKKGKLEINGEVDSKLNSRILEIFGEVKLFEKKHCLELGSEDAKTKENLIKRSKRTIMKAHRARMRFCFRKMELHSERLSAANVDISLIPSQVFPEFPERMQEFCGAFIKATAIFKKSKRLFNLTKLSMFQSDVDAKERFEQYKGKEELLNQHAKLVAEAVQCLEGQNGKNNKLPDEGETKYKENGYIKFTLLDPFLFEVRKEYLGGCIEIGKNIANKIERIPYMYLIAQFDEMIQKAESGEFADVKEIVKTLPETAQRNFFRTHWQTCGSPTEKSKEESQKKRSDPKFGRVSFLDLDPTKRCVASNEEKIQSLKDHHELLKGQLNELKAINNSFVPAITSTEFTEL
jgi:hypothetical protein